MAKEEFVKTEILFCFRNWSLERREREERERGERGEREREREWHCSTRGLQISHCRRRRLGPYTNPLRPPLRNRAFYSLSLSKQLPPPPDGGHFLSGFFLLTNQTHFPTTTAETDWGGSKGVTDLCVVKEISLFFKQRRYPDEDDDNRESAISRAKKVRKRKEGIVAHKCVTNKCFRKNFCELKFLIHRIEVY